MPSLQTLRVLAAVLVGAVLLGAAGWTGYELAAGRCAQEKHDAAVAYAEERNRVLEAARADLEAESRRAQESALRDARAAARRERLRLENEVAIARLARAECSLPAPMFERMSARIREANAARAASGETGRVPEGVPANAGSDRPE